MSPASPAADPVRDASLDEMLRPYLPALIIDWLRDDPGAGYRVLDGTLVFVDICGFTNLAEQLARAGQRGAEQLTQILGAVFTSWLSAACRHGAELIKWGGDGAVLLFQGRGHAAAACAAAREMLVTDAVASAPLRMSAGVHSGQIMFFLVGSGHRELVVTGPGVTQAVTMEAAAGAGQVVVSRPTAARLEPGAVGPVIGPGFLLRVSPPVPLRPVRRVRDVTGLGLGRCLPPPVTANLLAGGREGEHRKVAIAFAEFSGVDRLLTSDGLERVATALQRIIAAAQDAARANEVTFLGTDISAGGGTIMLVAGAPWVTGHEEARLLNTVLAILAHGGSLTLRAGAHTGWVFAGTCGPAYRRVYSVWGDAVNLAARLMARAAPGQLLVTADILEPSGRAFAVASQPSFPVRGKAHLVRAFDVRAMTDP